MNRSLAAILSGIFVVILFLILTGLTFIPPTYAMWLPLIGLILGGLIIGWGCTHRTRHLLLYAFFIYMGLMLFLAVNSTLLIGQVFGPLDFSQIHDAWTNFQSFVNTLPFLLILSNLALYIRTTLGNSLMAIFVEFLVASLFTGFIVLLLTGISGHLTRSDRVHVVTAPEAPPDFPETTPPMVPSPPTAPPEPVVPPIPSALPASAPEPPPPQPAPRPVEEALPPQQPLPKGGSPSAQAIAGLKGKVDKHLKGTGQKTPSGQSRCPHCQATIIRGSRFCNACEKPI